MTWDTTRSLIDENWYYCETECWEWNSETTFDLGIVKDNSWQTLADLGTTLALTSLVTEQAACPTGSPSDAVVCFPVAQTDDRRAWQNFSPRRPFLYNPWLSHLAPLSLQAQSSARIPNTEDLSPLMSSDGTMLSGHCKQMTFWKDYSPVWKPPFSNPHPSFLSFLPKDSEWQGRKTILWPPLNLLFLLRVLQRVIPRDERNLREMLPSSGRHAKERPQRAGIPSLVYKCPRCGRCGRCGRKALLCVLGITKKGYSTWSHMEAEETWMKFIIQ